MGDNQYDYKLWDRIEYIGAPVFDNVSGKPSLKRGDCGVITEIGPGRSYVVEFDGGIVRHVTPENESRYLAGRRLSGVQKESSDAEPRTARRKGPKPLAGRLTSRQMQILTLWASGISVSELCARLDIAPKTFHAHLQNLRSSLRIGRQELLLYAVLAGYAPVPPAVARLLPPKTPPQFSESSP